MSLDWAVFLRAVQRVASDFSPGSGYGGGKSHKSQSNYPGGALYLIIGARGLKPIE
ncbi:Uncharacterised protein [Scardovia inopinata]|uniref:Uncharacterized protein n=1 Tax=Scardovia inopinata F0304 TaxID=641146 RepID=W5IGV0_SCAIO|nr:hypothetical protein [Scardovia inopinata]EFG26073.1 hypothetical protein HMPREF9020_01148 [Scardovia inopinata F0304]BAR07294.1 hypothetical protein SCIP_1227 [Scardovia inopinata JCM 12537]SUV51368.1 Uncharacterised protein [Scardovia inopinata]